MRTKDIGATCPVCGKANECQLNNGKKCWCFDMQVDKARLERALKDKSKGQCLCKDCLKKFSV